MLTSSFLLQAQSIFWSSYATSSNNLAELYRQQGLYAKAEPLYIEGINIKEKVLGKEHPSYATSLNNLALLYKSLGLYAKAEPLYIEAKNIREIVLGKEHPSYASSLNNLAVLYYDQGLYAKAEPLFMEANSILLDNMDLNFSLLSEKEKGKYLKTFGFSFKAFNSFVLKRMEENPAVISGADIVFQPDVSGFDLVGWKDFDEIVEVGYHHAKEVLRKIT